MHACIQICIQLRSMSMQNCTHVVTCRLSKPPCAQSKDHGYLCGKIYMLTRVMLYSKSTKTATARSNDLVCMSVQV